jgi:hypothetical protein
LPAEPIAETEMFSEGEPSSEVVSVNQDSKTIALERYRATLSFWKYVLVSGFAAVVIAYLPPHFQYETAKLEDARKAREEAQGKMAFHDQYIKDFINMGLNQDIEIRIRLATYFANLSDDDYKQGWKDYLKALTDLRSNIRTKINEDTAKLYELGLTGGVNDVPTIRRLGRELGWEVAELGYARQDTDISVAASSIAELPKTVALQSRLKALTTDDEILALMKQMQPNLASRPQQIQSLVKAIDQKNVRLTDAAKARQVINAWLGEDDLTPTNQQQWLNAIAATSATANVVQYPKATNSKADIEKIQQRNLANGAKSSEITEDSSNWLLTTVWPGE